MKKGKKVAGAVATVTVFGVFTRLIGFLFKIYLSRKLGAEALGLYQIALSAFFLFASLTSAGIPMLLSRKTAEGIALEKNDTFSLFTSALILCGTASMTLALVLSLCGDHLDFLFSDPAALPIFLIMIPALVSTSVYCVVRGWLWGSKLFVAFSFTETVEEALRILFSVLLLSGVVASLSGVYAIAWAFTVSDVVVAALLFLLFFLKGGKLTKPAGIRQILLPSLPITVMRICSSLIGTLVAFLLPLRLVTAGMAPGDATASYGRIAGMATPLLNAPSAVIGSLCVVLIPELSARMVKGEYETLNKQLTLGVNFSFLISGLFIVLFSSLGVEITTLLYGDAVSGEYLQVATFCMLPVCLTQITQSSLNSIGKEYASFRNYVIGNILMLFAVYLLPPYIGIYAVAAATFLCTAVTGTLNVLTLKKATGLKTDFIKYALLVVIFLVPCYLFAEWINALLAPSLKAFSFLPAGIVGIGVYILLCMITNVLDVRGIVVGRFASLRKKARA